MPAYSPEVNPVEEIWRQLLKSYLANRVFFRVEELKQIIRQFFEERDYKLDMIVIEYVCAPLSSE